MVSWLQKSLSLVTLTLENTFGRAIFAYVDQSDSPINMKAGSAVQIILSVKELLLAPPIME